MGQGKVFVAGGPEVVRAQRWAKCGQERACEDTGQIAGAAGLWEMGRAPQQEAGGCRGQSVQQSLRLTWRAQMGPPHCSPIHGHGQQLAFCSISYSCGSFFSAVPLSTTLTTLLLLVLS